MEFAPAARRAPSGTRGDEGHAPQGCRKTLRAPQITLATAQSRRYNNRASNRSPIQVSIVSGYSEVGIAPGLGVPWRYPGQGKAKRRKALRHLRLRDFPRLPKAAQKRL